jgi:hypothetical protein
MIDLLERAGTQLLGAPPAADPVGERADETARPNDPLHRAGIEAIQRALSRDSRQFAREVRQEQGQ